MRAKIVRRDRRGRGLISGAYLLCLGFDVLVQIHDYVLVKVHVPVHAQVLDLQDEVLATTNNLE